MDGFLEINVMQFYGKYNFISAGFRSKGQRKIITLREWPCVVNVRPRIPRSWGREGDPRRTEYCRVQRLKHTIRLTVLFLIIPRFEQEVKERDTGVP